MADSHEGNNELMHSIKGREFLDQLSTISFSVRLPLKEIKKVTTLTVGNNRVPSLGLTVVRFLFLFFLKYVRRDMPVSSHRPPKCKSNQLWNVLPHPDVLICYVIVWPVSTRSALSKY